MLHRDAHETSAQRLPGVSPESSPSILRGQSGQCVHCVVVLFDTGLHKAAQRVIVEANIHTKLWCEPPSSFVLVAAYNETSAANDFVSPCCSHTKSSTAPCTLPLQAPLRALSSVSESRQSRFTASNAALQSVGLHSWL